jgi:hypothetical protein
LNNLTSDFVVKNILSNKEEAFSKMCYRENMGLIEKGRRLGVCCDKILKDFNSLKPEKAQ